MADQSQHKPYPEIASSPDFPAMEESILEFWKRAKVFEASVENRPAHKGTEKNAFVFYDGPPFANGLPHYGHLLTGFVKDLFPRYQTMKGKRVERRFGWDCHGLPAEMGAEKELGISGAAAIEGFGIEKFNDHCRTSVMKFRDEWEYYVGRQARWVDFDNDYKTMDRDFMESVMWAFKQLWDKGLVYESYRVMPYSWAAETPLSNFETRLDNAYRERTDKAVTAALKLTEVPDFLPDTVEEAHLLIWTTTPWTLPSNLAVAVGPDMPYVAIEKHGKAYILAVSSLSAYAKELELEEEFILGNLSAEMAPALDSHGQEHPAIAVWRKGKVEAHLPEEVDGFTIYEAVHGEALVGLSYEPLFPYFADTPNAFRVLSGDFIEEGEGTGIVHMAPGFGEDDQRICADNGIEVICPVDRTGCYTDALFDLGDASRFAVEEPETHTKALVPLSLKGLNVIAAREKCEDEPYSEAQLAKYGLANLRIINWLKLVGALIKQDDYVHNYPHCWRTDQPLIYKALPSWYVEVTKFRDRMVELNQQINWIPSHVKDGLFGKWLENARDWSISRNRYWGSPIPVWKSNNPNSKEPIKVFGSIKELSGFFGVKVEDLHRPYIDALVKEDGEGYEYRRVSDVFDCWFESGSMPYAQVHYPFENADWFDAHSPADFIVEYTAQTRGWFYTLMVLSTALFDKPPFLNCICHGVVLDAEGQKLSKRLNNYPDPRELFDKYGADALRWFMMSSPVMRGQELYIDKEGNFIRDAVRLYIKPIWNAYHFFTLYANADGLSGELLFEGDATLKTDNLLDSYILAKLREVVAEVESALDGFDTPGACAAITQFLEVLNNWYIRRNRDRFWKSEKDADKQDAYNTLYTVLHMLSRTLSPLLPLISEEIYLGLTVQGAREAYHSVHLADWPDYRVLPEDQALVAGMDRVRDACNVALSIRKANDIRIRQPLASITFIGISDTPMGEDFRQLVLDEANVEQWENLDSERIHDFADPVVKLDFKILGKRLGKAMKDVSSAVNHGAWELQADGTLKVAGQVLAADAFSFRLEPRDAYRANMQALSSNDALVMLDLDVTDELKQKGIARDLIRMIQQARKDADLNISDRIDLVLDLPGEILHAAETHQQAIAEQVLANRVRLTALEGEHQFRLELDGQAVGVGISVSTAAKDAA